MSSDYDLLGFVVMKESAAGGTITSWTFIHYPKVLISRNIHPPHSLQISCIIAVLASMCWLQVFLGSKNI